MPASTAEGDCASGGKGYSLLFRREADRRLLYAHMEHFDGRAPLDAYIELTDERQESMVICTPFDKPGHFYFNQKINCLRASGKVTVGEDEYMLDPSDSFAVLDWGPGGVDLPQHLVLGLRFRACGGDSLRLQPGLWLWQHLRCHGEYAVL